MWLDRRFLWGWAESPERLHFTVVFMAELRCSLHQKILMNTLELLRRKWRNHRRQKKFASSSGIPNFRMVPAWLLKQLQPDAKFHAQSGQDWFVATYIFPKKTDGVFVDVGANHPTEINNTLYFEEQGWTGIAFEPQQELVELWAVERKARCLPYLLGSEKKRVSFRISYEHALSSVVGSSEKSSSDTQCVEIEQRRLDEALLENGIEHVDYMSIDVEGYEKEVLSGLDFSRVNIQCLVLENDHSRFGEEYSRELSRKNDYRFVARVCGDDVFVKRGSEAENHYLNDVTAQSD